MPEVFKDSLRGGDTTLAAYSDGEVFRAIRRLQLDNYELAASSWMARLSSSKRNDITQLLRGARRSRLLHNMKLAFDDLLRFPGLWAGFRGGCLKRILATRCFEVSQPIGARSSAMTRNRKQRVTYA